MGTKKFELQITLQENPIILREGQDTTVIRGHVVVFSREIQPLRMIQVLLTGTKVLVNAQQMGSTGTGKQVLVNETKTLQHDNDSPPLAQYAVGTYTLPFEFIINQSLPPTLRVPRCTIEYAVSATALKFESAPPLLRMFSPKAPKAQIDLRLVGYATGADPSDFLARLNSVTRVGTLGAHKNGRGTLPYRVVMDKNVVAPGDVIKFKLSVFPSGVVPNFNPAEFAALIKVVDSSNSSARKAGTASESDDYASDQGSEPSRPVDSGNRNASDATDDEEYNEVATRDHSQNASTTISLNGIDGAPLDRPPTYHAADSNDLALSAAASMAGNKTTVTAYKVDAKLVQRVCYMADHDLVADANNSVYLFWTKRVVAKERVSDSLDITRAPLHLEWSMTVPGDLQHDILTSDIQVRYDVYLDFYPREHSSGAGGSSTRAFRDVVSRVSNHCLSSRLPLRTIPVPLSTMLANPPLYSG
ncbi:hypothetical protein GGI19_000197 [Coemansia pectinata]|uniref:Arrestin-like N-terminal domain-containing protein n=1 Tax=Coemansia pectinata TaxID=1052879 RepID=A0A9W8H4I7_9FUNG|nr:hypothetical protein GGI19_000197 [Coemansia pectinata]